MTSSENFKQLDRVLTDVMYRNDSSCLCDDNNDSSSNNNNKYNFF